MANEIMIANSGESADQWTELQTSYSLAGILFMGNNEDGGSDRSYTSAQRFRDVTAPNGGVNYVGFYLWVQYNGKDESPRDGQWKFDIRAIDEDNTSDFGSNPLGRSRTTNKNDSDNDDEPDTGQYKEITVTSAANEVFQRGSWSSGNALALVFENDGSGKNKYAGEIADRNSFLLIRVSAEPNFKPTPKEVAAPTFPSADSYGMKISYPGYEVDTATEDQTYFTTRKRCMKVVTSGKINTTGGVVSTIAHGQSVKPFARAWFKSITSGKRYQIPRYMPGEYQDPDADVTNGQIEIDATNVKILTTDSCEVYYYIYIDELKA